MYCPPRRESVLYVELHVRYSTSVTYGLPEYIHPAGGDLSRT